MYQSGSINSIVSAKEGDVPPIKIRGALRGVFGPAPFAMGGADQPRDVDMSPTHASCRSNFVASVCMISIVFRDEPKETFGHYKLQARQHVILSSPMKGPIFHRHRRHNQTTATHPYSTINLISTGHVTSPSSVTSRRRPRPKPKLRRNGHEDQKNVRLSEGLKNQDHGGIEEDHGEGITTGGQEIYGDINAEDRKGIGRAIKAGAKPRRHVMCMWEIISE